MLGHFKTGDAVAFVGAPHVRGVSKLLREAGFQIKGPDIPQEDDRGLAFALRASLRQAEDKQ